MAIDVIIVIMDTKAKMIACVVQAFCMFDVLIVVTVVVVVVVVVVTINHYC